MSKKTLFQGWHNIFLTVLTLSVKYQNGLAVGKPTALFFVAEHRRGNYLPLLNLQLLPFA